MIIKNKTFYITKLQAHAHKLLQPLKFLGNNSFLSPLKKTRIPSYQNSIYTPSKPPKKTPTHTRSRPTLSSSAASIAADCTSVTFRTPRPCVCVQHLSPSLAYNDRPPRRPHIYIHARVVCFCIYTHTYRGRIGSTRSVEWNARIDAYTRGVWFSTLSACTPDARNWSRWSEGIGCACVIYIYTCAVQGLFSRRFVTCVRENRRLREWYL